MKNYGFIIIILLFVVSIIFITCDKDKKIEPCLLVDPGIVPQPPYDSPIWHPSGQFIGFNHTPLDSISYPYGTQCWGNQHFRSDSTGFWLINPDGLNMRRIYPRALQCPAWSPDGQWMAFVIETQIFKMKFTGTTFDTTSLTQLTFEGSNFFPAWSPDGLWIAYNKSICDGPNTCGIWLMSSIGTQNRFLVSYGNFPSWHPLSDKILYWTVAVTQQGQIIGDTLWTFDRNTDSRSVVIFLSGQNRDTRHAKYSPDAMKIAYWSNNDVWFMDTTGSNQYQLTTEGVDASFGLPFSWSPDGSQLVYTVFQSNDWGYENGTLWIVNPYTGQNIQLTFNIKRTK